MVYFHKDTTIEANVLDLVMAERRRAANTTEWHDALVGHGYAVRRTGAGTVITTLPHGVEVCRLPSSPAFDTAI